MIYEDSYKQFLSNLDQIKNKEIYAKITALSFAELPIETIEGRVTGGSINVDGASAIRRSCSLTITAENFNYNNYYWGLNSKFKLEIGVKNSIDLNMPDIIWFNQGIYLITSFNTSRSANSFSISLSGKDKMCLLNGEIGGTLESSVDFGTIEEENNNGIWTIRKIPIIEIIKNMVHTYAGEPYHNIIINDLDTYGLELLEYRYDIPMYLYRAKNNTDLFYNMIIENDSLTLYIKEGQNYIPVKLSELDINHLDILVDSLVDDTHEVQSVYFKVGNAYEEYIFAKVEYGQTAGYRISDLIYPGDLIANAGESITSVLDKIKTMLVEFEYFYDLDGHFVFQKKKSFISTMWSPLNLDSYQNESVQESLAVATANAYIFKDNQIITAFNNNPNLLNLRNDYSIWGERKGISDAAIPIHLRYAIDKKPISYTQINTNDAVAQEQIQAYNIKYDTKLKGNLNPQTFSVNNNCDWREIIYQMAVDYYKFNFLEDFELRVAAANPAYHTGQTGYEKYYIDLQGFWRQLYNPNFVEDIDKKQAEITQLENQKATLEDANEIEILQQQIDSLTNDLKELEEDMNNYYYYDYDENNNIIYDYQVSNNEKMFWLRNVYEHPELLNFWFDFLDTEGQLQQFNVKNVGSRSKTVNETTIKSIYFRETPAVVFTENINNQNRLSGYRYLQIPEHNLIDMFTISSQGKSAKERLDELLYTHGYCTETANITTLPIYHLDVNTRIYVHNSDSSINGDYIVNKLTIPLVYNGTMTISATKAAENVL